MILIKKIFQKKTTHVLVCYFGILNSSISQSDSSQLYNSFLWCPQVKTLQKKDISFGLYNQSPNDILASTFIILKNKIIDTNEISQYQKLINIKYATIQDHITFGYSDDNIQVKEQKKINYDNNRKKIFGLLSYYPLLEQIKISSSTPDLLNEINGCKNLETLIIEKIQIDNSVFNLNDNSLAKLKKVELALDYNFNHQENKIDFLLTEFFKINGIEELKMEGFKNHFPSTVDNLINLRKFYFVGDINAIPSQFGKLINLDTISILNINDTIANFKVSFTNLHKLNYFDIYSQSKINFEKSTQNLPNLKTLHLSCSNDAIPEFIYKALNLTKLTLHSLYLKKLPKKLGTLRYLEKFSLLEIANDSLQITQNTFSSSYLKSIAFNGAHGSKPPIISGLTNIKFKVPFSIGLNKVIIDTSELRKIVGNDLLEKIAIDYDYLDEILNYSKVSSNLKQLYVFLKRNPDAPIDPDGTSGYFNITEEEKIQLKKICPNCEIKEIYYINNFIDYN